MKNYSIWNETKIKNYPNLNEDKNIDILIIGGGITGINILYQLKDKDVILVERNKIGQGVTLNTTGKLTYLQDNIYNNIIKNYNEEKASLYLKSQLLALNEIKNIIKNNNIKCDFEKIKSYVFTNNNKDIGNIKILKKFLINNNIKVYENDIPILKYKYSISVDDTYLFNPIKYIDELLKNIDNKIYENTNIEKIERKNNKYICYTKNNKIICNKVVLATHYPYFIYPYFFPLKGYIEKSDIISYKKKINNISLISYSKPTISIRTYKDNIIYLFNSHNICNYKKIKLKNNIEYVWSNSDIITNDYLPYIGYIKDNLIIATGFNTWGMTNSLLSGIIIKDLILNKNNEYIKLFDPKRNKKISRIISDSCSSIKGYIEGIKYSNIKTKCPHAKGKLIYNKIENTYDCPCHGSRFDINGKCINGPSNKDVQIKKDITLKQHLKSS